MTTNISTQTLVNPESRAWSIGLWVGQVVLAALFALSGAMKVFSSIDQLAQAMPWAASAPYLVRFIGLSELAGAVGLILPALTRILPVLTPLAASGLATIMALATAFHLVRGEFSHVPVTLILGALAVVVAWGRFSKAPILPR